MRLRGLQGATNAWGSKLLMHAAFIHSCVSVSLQVGNSCDVLYAALCYSCMGPSATNACSLNILMRERVLAGWKQL